MVAACSSSGSDIAQDGSPNSNNPNFVIIGDAFGFSVLLDWYGTAKDGRAIVDIPTYIIGMMGV